VLSCSIIFLLSPPKTYSAPPSNPCNTRKAETEHILL
jgi:hypothetical protein